MPMPPNQPPASKWVTFLILDLGQVLCLTGVIHYSSTETTTARFATYVISDLVTTLCEVFVVCRPNKLAGKRNLNLGPEDFFKRK